MTGLSCWRASIFYRLRHCVVGFFLAPIALVSSLRKTLVLFAVGLGVILLGERFTIFKICLTLVILSGIIFLRLGQAIKPPHNN